MIPCTNNKQALNPKPRCLINHLFNKLRFTLFKRIYQQIKFKTRLTGTTLVFHRELQSNRHCSLSLAPAKVTVRSKISSMAERFRSVYVLNTWNTNWKTGFRNTHY